MTDAVSTPPPKHSENDPPAADRPVAESPGSPPPRPVDTADLAGRKANDPSSVKAVGLVPERHQTAAGKPDGEVDTGKKPDHRTSLFNR